jgi:TfoX/Sxy family transcriptional regulator of competence genes
MGRNILKYNPLGRIFSPTRLLFISSLTKEEKVRKERRGRKENEGPSSFLLRSSTETDTRHDSWQVKEHITRHGKEMKKGVEKTEEEERPQEEKEPRRKEAKRMC